MNGIRWAALPHSGRLLTVDDQSSVDLAEEAAKMLCKEENVLGVICITERYQSGGRRKYMSGMIS